MKIKTILLNTFIVSGIIFYASCKEETSPTPTPTPTPAATLYERVGGTTLMADPANPGVQIEKGRFTLRAVVDSSILVIAADPQMAPYFPVLFAELGMGNTSGLDALSESFTDFMCFATGSKNPNYGYGGRSMKDAHDPAKYNRIAQKVNSADFDKFVGDIGIGLAQNGVNATNNKQLVDDLVALLYTTKADIVQR